MDAVPANRDPHSVHSSLRERIIEHVFVGEVLRLFWRRNIFHVEVLRSEFDAYGYDLVMSHGEIVRHIQLKTSIVGGARREVSAGLSLMEKPSGCILWIIVTADLEIDHYLWFGSSPGTPLPRLQDMKIARHTKGDADGTKLERPNHREIPRTRFERLGTLGAVVDRLFGPIPPTRPAQIEADPTSPTASDLR